MNQKKLIRKIIKASNIIAKKRRSSANLVILHPKVAEQVKKFILKQERKEKLKKLLNKNL